MRDMKDSGIDWISIIPEYWQVSKIKYHSEVKGGSYYTERDLVNEGEGAILLSPSNIDSMKINYSKCTYISWFKYNESPEIMVKSGDTLFVKTGSYGKSCYVDNLPMEATINPQLIVFKNININKKLFSYIIQSNFIAYQSELAFVGSIIPTISQAKIGNFSIIIPTSKEQKQIADFLDRKCSEINALRLEIEKEIATLKKYKKSIITEAVTKGLNKNVPMKDSGIEWIDSIPNLWHVIRLKYAYWLKGRIGWQGLRADEFVENENCPYLITGTDFYEGYIDWGGCVHITEERFSQDSFIHVKENDLLITKDGTIGKVAIAKKCPEKVSLNTGVLIMRNTRNYKCSNKYIYYVISSNQFFDWYKLNHSGNSTIKHLNQEKFYNFQFILPSYTEQKQIADYLDHKCSEIDDIIKAKNKQLSTLEEYKKSLIYEYVTGKKEVHAHE